MKDRMNRFFNMTTALIAGGLVLTVLLMMTDCVLLSWLIVGAAGCYALWQLWCQYSNWQQNRSIKVARRERLLRVLAAVMGLFLVTGTVLFLIAFHWEQADSEHESKQFMFVNAEYLLRSIVCSLDLFMLDIDNNLLDGIKGHGLLKGLIAVQAVLSFMCTVAILIGLAYARVKAYLKLHKRTTIDDSHDHLFVFFDMSKASQLLARSIRKREGDRAVIVFVIKSPVDDDDRRGWDSIVGMFTNKEQTFRDANETDARVTFTETRPCDIDIDDLLQDDSGADATGDAMLPDILGQLNLCRLRTLIEQLDKCSASPELHIIFLSENEEENIRSVATLSHDSTINSCGAKVKKRLYCHARHTGANRVIEDITMKMKMEVSLVDSAHLSIEQLKKDERNHPVRLVTLSAENPTTVSSTLTCLIVGFDEAGQDALRFLYEYGAFVDSRSTVQSVRRSPFDCTIVDPRIKELEGYFHAFTPAVMSHEERDGVSIRMEAFDSRDTAFYRLLDRQALRQRLNYVVVAVGDDEQGITCAIRLFNYVRQVRHNLSNLRIFVRMYKAEKEDYMQNIAHHYNEGYNNDVMKSLSDAERSAYKPVEVIIPFGQQDRIYSYEMIIDEQLKKDGMKFFDGYERQRYALELLQRKEGTKPIAWTERHDKAFADGLSLDNIRSLRRKEFQDISNAQHAKTKLYLLRHALGNDYDWAGFLSRYFLADGITPNRTGSCATINYPMLTAREHQAIVNLACLEHLRWNASHEMLGYVKGGDDLHCCDERRREHNCLLPWEDLDMESEKASTATWKADYKAFDFSVVDVSLQLYQALLK